MGARCLVCMHPERARIELALVRGVPYPRLVAQYGMSVASLSRHRKVHIPPQLKAALATGQRPTAVDLEKLRVTESESLLQNLVSQRGQLALLIQLAEEAGHYQVATSAHRVILKNLEVTARLLGEITAGAQTTVNQLIVSPAYLQLRSGLLRALQDHPAARRAVGTVLAELEGAPVHVTGVWPDRAGAANAGAGNAGA